MSSRKVFVVGGHTTQFLGKGHPNFIWKKHPDFGKRENPTLREMLTECVTGALKYTGVTATQVDRAYVGNFASELFCNQGHLGAALPGVDSGFMYKPCSRVEGACASGGLAISSAVDAIKSSNTTNLVLVAGVEQQTTASARDGGLYLARAADFDRQSGIDDFTFPCLLARRCKAYCEKYYNNDKSKLLEDLSWIVAKAYKNGNLNERAHMKEIKMDLEAAKGSGTFLSNEEYHDFMRLADCSQVSDGGSAIILASEEGLAANNIPLSQAAEIVGLEYGCGNLYEDAADLASLDVTREVTHRLFDNTNLSIKNFQLAEVHDCFSIAELGMYEAIGLADPGSGGNVCKEGRTDIATDNGVAVNTGGGLIAFGHPVGATGVKQVHEIYRQMKKECGDYQVKRHVEHGLTVNMGGDDKTIVAMAIRNQ